MDSDDALTRLGLMATATPKQLAALITSEPHVKQLQKDLREMLPRSYKWKPDEEMTRYLDGVVGVVEASRCEQYMLWAENDRISRRSWISSTSGYGETVGSVSGMPVHVSLSTATVDGHKLVFADAVSRVVDHTMVRDWLEAALPKTARKADGRLNITDAMNFHNVFPHPATPAPSDGAPMRQGNPATDESLILSSGEEGE